MLLNRVELERMRALPESVCAGCGATTTRDYCRDHDEFFERGHQPGCLSHSEHERDRSYTGFDATVETGMAELTVEYARERSGCS